MPEPGIPDVSGTPLSLPTGNLDAGQLQGMLESFMSPVSESLTSSAEQTHALTEEQLAESQAIKAVLSDIKKHIKETDKNTKNIRDRFQVPRYTKTVATAVERGMKSAGKKAFGDPLKTHLDKLTKDITRTLAKGGGGTGGGSGLEKSIKSLESTILKTLKKREEKKPRGAGVLGLEGRAKKRLGADIKKTIEDVGGQIDKMFAEGFDEKEVKALNKRLEDIIKLSKQEKLTRKQMQGIMGTLKDLQEDVADKQKTTTSSAKKWVTAIHKAAGAFKLVSSAVGAISYGQMTGEVLDIEKVLQRSSVAMYGMASVQSDIRDTLEEQATQVQKISKGYVSNLQAAKGQNILFQQGIRDFSKQQEILTIAAVSAQEMNMDFEEIVEYTGDMAFHFKLSRGQSKFLIRDISNISKQFGLSAKQVKNIQQGMKDTLKNLRNIRGATATAIEDFTRMRTAVEKERGNIDIINDVTEAFTGGMDAFAQKFAETGVFGVKTFVDLTTAGKQSAREVMAGMTNSEQLTRSMLNVSQSAVNEINAMNASGRNIADINIYVQRKYGMAVNDILNTNRGLLKATEGTVNGAIDAFDRYGKKIESIKKLDSLSSKEKKAMIAETEEQMNVLGDNIHTSFTRAATDIKSVLQDYMLGDKTEFEVKQVLEGDAGVKLGKTISGYLENTDLMPKGVKVKGLQDLQTAISKMQSTSDKKEATPELLKKLSSIIQVSSKESDTRMEDLNKTAIDNARDAIRSGRHEATAIYQDMSLGLFQEMTGMIKQITKWGSLFLGPMLLLMQAGKAIGGIDMLFSTRGRRRVGRQGKVLAGRVGQAAKGTGEWLAGTLTKLKSSKFGANIAKLGSRIFGKTGIIASGLMTAGSKIGGFFKTGGGKGFFKAVGGLFGKFGKLGGSFARLAGGAGKAIPVAGWVLAGVMAVVDAFKGWKNADKILGKNKENLNLIDKASAAIASIWGGLVGILDSLLGLFGIHTDMGGATTKFLAKVFSGFWNTIWGFAKTIIKSVIVPWKTVWDIIKSVGKTIWDGIVAAFMPAVEGLKKAWAGLKESFSALGKTFYKLRESLKEAIGKLWNSFKELGKALLPILKVIGAVIIAPFYIMYKAVQTLAKIWHWIGSKIWNFVKPVLIPVAKALLWGLKQLGKVLGFIASIPILVIQGLTMAVNGIVKGITWLTDKVTGFVNWIADNVSEAINSVANSVTGAFEWIKGKVLGAWETAKSFASSPIDAIANAYSWISDKVSSAFRTIQAIISSPFLAIAGVFSWMNDKVDALFSAIKKRVADSWLGKAAIKLGLIDIKEEGATKTKKPAKATDVSYTDRASSAIAKADTETKRKMVEEKYKAHLLAPLLTSRSNIAVGKAEGVSYNPALISRPIIPNKRIIARSQDVQEQKQRYDESRIPQARMPSVGGSQFAVSGGTAEIREGGGADLSAAQLSALNSMGSDTSDMVRLLAQIANVLSSPSPRGQRSIPGTSPTHKPIPGATFTTTEGSKFLGDASWQNTMMNASGGSNENMPT